MDIKVLQQEKILFFLKKKKKRIFLDIKVQRRAKHQQYILYVVRIPQLGKDPSYNIFLRLLIKLLYLILTSIHQD